jgi:hypothetical protein
MTSQVAKFFLDLPGLARRLGLPDGQEITLVQVQYDPPRLVVYVRGEDLYDPKQYSLSGWENGSEAVIVRPPAAATPNTVQTPDARRGENMRQRVKTLVTPSALAAVMGLPAGSAVTEVGWTEDPSAFLVTVESYKKKSIEPAVHQLQARGRQAIYDGSNSVGPTD